MIFKQRNQKYHTNPTFFTTKPNKIHSSFSICPQNKKKKKNFHLIFQRINYFFEEKRRLKTELDVGAVVVGGIETGLWCCVCDVECVVGWCEFVVEFVIGCVVVDEVVVGVEVLFRSE